MEVDRAGQADIAFQVIEQGTDRVVTHFDERLDDRRRAQADAPRLPKLAGRDLIEVGDQGGDPCFLIGPGGGTGGRFGSRARRS